MKHHTSKVSATVIQLNKKSKEYHHSKGKAFFSIAMLTLKPSTFRPPCRLYPYPPHHVADLFVPLPPSSLPPDASVSVNKHHGRSGSGAQQALSLSVVVEKEPSCKRPFVSFQNYLWVFKADRCCVYPVVYHPSFSSPELLFWEMPLV